MSSAPVQVTGSTGSAVATAALAVKPPSLDDLKGPNDAYEAYARRPALAARHAGRDAAGRPAPR
ncbi:MAG: hypothetical protein PGN11_16605 [Quadrisphaera sp.]